MTNMKKQFILIFWAIIASLSFTDGGPCQKVFNPQTIQKYANLLKPYVNEIQSKHALDKKEIEESTKIVTDYYNYLGCTGIKYGQAALDVVNDDAAFGKLANQHLIAAAEREGKSSKEIENAKYNIRVALAYQDALLRFFEANSTGFIPYSDIAKYHYNVFQQEGLSKYAWGGTLFENFLGSGSWMNIGGYDTSVEIKPTELTDAIIFKKKSEKNGIQLPKALLTIIDTSLGNKANLFRALVQRTLICFKQRYPRLAQVFTKFSVSGESLDNLLKRLEQQHKTGNCDKPSKHLLQL